MRHHVLDRGADVGFRQPRIAALGRHGALAVQRHVEQRLHPERDARGPVRLVAELGRARGAGAVTGDAGVF